MDPTEPQKEKSLRRLYPSLDDAQLKEADENLKRYIALALRVFERLEHDADAWARFESLTASRREPRMNGTRKEANPAIDP